MQRVIGLCPFAFFLAATFGAGQLAGAEAQTGRAPATMTIHVDRPGPAISPMLYGLFFEEINHAGDGGLYAELVRNRSFEDSEKPDHWTLQLGAEAKGEMTIEVTRPLNPLNRRSLRLHVTEAGQGGATLVNEGFWGIPLAKGAAYRLSLAARAGDGFQGQLRVALQTSGGEEAATGTIEALTADWKGYTLTLSPNATDPNGRLLIQAPRAGTVWLDLVSLFPQKTWKDRPNGLRPDLAQKLAELRPSFVRFPGGCWVEGEDLRTSYHWKETIGDIGQRRNQWNLWQYNSTHGLGFLEYLILCDDLGAEPLFVINCGMSHRENVPLDQMAQWVQDALDALEYANGTTNTLWGALRARHGHPAPFHLKYLEIGNENGGPPYHERYALFYDALKARHPEVRLIADEWGGAPKSRPVEIVDEHYYSNPEFFMNNAHRYDSYDRHGPKVYVGEYAVTQGCGQGNLRAALGEAAFMTGLERNADVVIMASYAPLFANVHYKKWNPNLINFDSASVYGLPSYYVQQMFSEARGDVVLPLELTAPPPPPLAARESPRGKIGLGTWLTQAEFKDVRVTRGDKTLLASDFSSDAAGWSPRRGRWAPRDGAYQQTANDPDLRSVAGDATWSDYTYTVKARKLGGAEGFLIMFQVQDDDNWLWWNLGGWGNARHAIERAENGGKSIIGQEVSGSIETGRWYDIRIELQGPRIRCYLDGKLVHDVTPVQPQPLYAVASRVRSTGELLLKAVNVTPDNIETQINLRGARQIEPKGSVVVLTSADPLDENSLAEPVKVAPRTQQLTNASASFRHAFPAFSVSVLRLKAQ